MSNVVQFKSLDLQIKEAEDLADYYQKMASSAHTHFIFRASDSEHETFKHNLRLEQRERRRVERLKEKRAKQRAQEIKLKEAFK